MILEIKLSVFSGLSHVSVTAIRSALLSLINSRKEADLFLIDLTLRRQPLRDLEPGPGLRLIIQIYLLFLEQVYTYPNWLLL